LSRDDIEKHHIIITNFLYLFYVLCMGMRVVIAITLGLILLGGTILGSTPFAFADEDDDKKEKLKAKLKDLFEKIKAKIEAKNDDDKCPEKFKYGKICDKKKPEIEIEEPENNDKLPAGMITIEIEAEDDETGIKKVEVRINGGPFLPATQVDDDEWEFKQESIKLLQRQLTMQEISNVTESILR